MNQPNRIITVESPARLHLGFVDLNGELGRKFGSLGLALDGISTVVTAQRADALVVTGAESERAQSYAEAVLNHFDCSGGARLEISRAIPAHAGLGSGTQLGLAVATALTTLFEIPCTATESACLTSRGKRSGIGIGAFEHGGFIIDAGRAGNDDVPPVIMRLEFPRSWHVVLIHDDERHGLSGDAETSAFSTLPPMAEVTAGTLCRAVLMGVAPALATGDFLAFSRHMNVIQTLNGDYFAPAQGGRFTSPAVRDAIEWLTSEFEVCACGQTSWGPTGFIFAETATRASEIVTALTQRYADSLRYSIHQARNHGAATTVESAELTASALV